MPPGPEGIDLAHEAQTIGFRGPVVLILGAFPPDLSERLLAGEVDRVPAKPISTERLAEALFDALEKGG